jgi:hypothetical protein
MVVRLSLIAPFSRRFFRRLPDRHRMTSRQEFSIHIWLKATQPSHIVINAAMLGLISAILPARHATAILIGICI